MNIIEKCLNEASVDWVTHEPSGLHLVSADDYTPQLLTDITDRLAKPVKGINYGNFYIIVANDEIKQAVETMRQFGFNPVSGTIIDTPKKSKYDIDSIVEEIANELSTEQLFKQFGKAMKVLGEQMGVGPIQDLLKKRGINWRMADDNNSLVFYTKNETGQEQRIARVSAESIGSQNEFQDQLLNMYDFATGEAPGTFKQKQETMRDQERLVQDVSKTVWPSDDSSKVASMMLNDE